MPNYSRKFRRNSRNFRKYRGGGDDEPAPTENGNSVISQVEDAGTNALNSITGIFKNKSENDTTSDSPGMFDSVKNGVSGAFSSVKNILPGSSSSETPANTGGRRSRRSRKNRSRKNRRSRR